MKGDTVALVVCAVGFDPENPITTVQRATFTTDYKQESKVSAAVMMAPSVFQRTKSPRSSPGNLPRKLQNGTGSNQAENTADSSPGNSISDAENFECYGEADGDASNNTVENGSRSPGNPLNRHSWTRTSLRRTPPSHQENLPNRRWGSMRHSGKRQIGSNVLASQLYRSSSFNSSGCGSGGEPADDMYSDVSLEEDVQGLNYKIYPTVAQVSSLRANQAVLLWIGGVKDSGLTA
ncbi:unnamed protein product [Leptosia nina]|uniref:Uncharacterized protein n=1 Tax=Leptosia nina TaxID=320188 RepID=A0AAV1J8L7_9NEOP